MFARSDMTLVSVCLDRSRVSSLDRFLQDTVLRVGYTLHTPVCRPPIALGPLQCDVARQFMTMTHLGRVRRGGVDCCKA